MSRGPSVSCVLCLKCGTLLFSLSQHDYRTCDCPNEAMIDGGDAYLRCGAKNLKDIISGRFDLSTFQFLETPPIVEVPKSAVAT